MQFLRKFNCMFKEYLNKNWRWENYLNFFNIQIFRYLILWFSIVPIIAGITNQLPDPLSLAIGNDVHKIRLVLPFTWQLLWLSSLSFVISFVIYKFMCPDFILKYNSYSDYKARSHDRRWLSWEAYYMWRELDVEQKNKFVKVVIEKKFAEKVHEAVSAESFNKPVVGGRQTIFYFSHNSENYKIALPSIIDGADHEVEQCGLFYEIFGRYTSSKIFARLFIFILLLLSLVLFSLAFIQHIVAGAKLVLAWFFSV